MKKPTFTAEPGKQEIVIRSSFEASRECVFDAFTDPRLIVRWWGPEAMNTLIDMLDPRAGGLWRFVQSDAAGNSFAFHGVFHELACPERLVYTFESEAMPGHAALEVVTLEEQAGLTLLTDRLIYQSVEQRDERLGAGMEAASMESMQRLAKLMVKLANVYA